MDENERLATLVALNECSGRLDSATKGMESIAKWFDTWSGAMPDQAIVDFPAVLP